MAIPANAWDNYWIGSEAGVSDSEGISHPVLDEFWQRQFESVGDDEIIVDLGCGRGALLQHLPDRHVVISLDLSAAALRSLRSRRPEILPLAADLQRLPVKASSVDRVVSQFGVEYGGAAALESLADLVAPGGWIQAVLHCRNSVVDKESRACLAATERFLAIGFIQDAVRMFEMGYEVLKGNATPGDARPLAVKVAEDIRSVNDLFADYGPDITGGSIRSIVENVGRIQAGIQNYDEQEVMGWIGNQQGEMNDYAERLRSMIDAALSDQLFEGLCEQLSTNQFVVREAKSLMVNQGEPLAWVLVAQKSG